MASVQVLRSASLTGGDNDEPVAVTSATGNLFRLLGVEAAHGRTFRPQDELRGADQVAVITHQFWQSRFGSAPGMVGRTIALDGRAHLVVGIMPEEFELTIGRVQVAVPLPLTSVDLPRDVQSLEVWGRLKPGVSPDQADSEMAILAGHMEREYPDTNGGYGARVLTLQEFMALGPMYLLQGALVFVLLIACANVANLLLARGQDRRHDLAVRAALGAPRHRTVRLLLSESALLALGGGLAGCLLTVWGVQLLDVVVAGRLPRSMTPEMNLLVLGFGLGISVLAGLLCGLVPAAQAWRPSVTAELQGDGRGVGAGARSRLLGRGLVVAEVALALVMLSGAGLFIRGLGEWRQQDPGFEVDNLLTVRLALPQARSANAGGVGRPVVAPA